MFFYVCKEGLVDSPPMERKLDDLASLIPIHCSLSGSHVLGMGGPVPVPTHPLLALSPPQHSTLQISWTEHPCCSCYLKPMEGSGR